MPDTNLHEANNEYTKHLGFVEQEAAGLKRRHISIGNWRLALFIAAIVLGYVAFSRHAVSPWWLAVPVVVFFVLAFVDDATLRKQRAAERRIQYYKRGLLRIEESWQSSGNDGWRFASSSHAYATDLDLFSAAGLFQLLSVARTGPGESLLAAWLMAPATVDQIRWRHSAIGELRTLLSFRETLATVGEHAIGDAEAAPLWKWGEEKAPRVTAVIRMVAALLSAAMAISLAWFAFADFEWLAGASSHAPLLAIRVLIAATAVTGAFGLWWRKQIAGSIAAFETIRPGLALLADLLVVVEQAQFASPELQETRRKLLGEVKPSAQIARLNRFADLLDSRGNLLLRIFGPPLLWTTQTAFAIEEWRARYGPTTRGWVEAISQMEALCSLATYSYEHPEDPFPDVRSEGTEFEAVDLGHPLLPGCVRNSLSLTGEHALLIISGSNMSGKSTLLRTIGINAVLALSGAPVRAQSLRISILSVATSLHVADSLRDGASHFSAEIARIRQIVEIARQKPPALFLIDEILQGTNSDDRRVGSEAILTQLLNLGAIGAITTHDLALTGIIGANPGRVVNAHFKDQIRDGGMAFDYKLKAGVVEGSNALALMRLYGLI